MAKQEVSPKTSLLQQVLEFFQVKTKRTPSKQEQTELSSHVDEDGNAINLNGILAIVYGQPLNREATRLAKDELFGMYFKTRPKIINQPLTSKAVDHEESDSFNLEQHLGSASGNTIQPSSSDESISSKFDRLRQQFGTASHKRNEDLRTIIERLEKEIPQTFPVLSSSENSPGEPIHDPPALPDQNADKGSELQRPPVRPPVPPPRQLEDSSKPPAEDDQEDSATERPVQSPTDATFLTANNEAAPEASRATGARQKVFPRTSTPIEDKSQHADKNSSVEFTKELNNLRKNVEGHGNLSQQVEQMRRELTELKIANFSMNSSTRPAQAAMPNLGKIASLEQEAANLAMRISKPHLLIAECLSEEKINEKRCKDILDQMRHLEIGYYETQRRIKDLSKKYEMTKKFQQSIKDVKCMEQLCGNIRSLVKIRLSRCSNNNKQQDRKRKDPPIHFEDPPSSPDKKRWEVYTDPPVHFEDPPASPDSKRWEEYTDDEADQGDDDITTEEPSNRTYKVSSNPKRIPVHVSHGGGTPSPMYIEDKYYPSDLTPTSSDVDLDAIDPNLKTPETTEVFHGMINIDQDRRERRAATRHQERERTS